MLVDDLVDDLEAAALDALEDRRELVGLGLELGQRGEDLAGGDGSRLRVHPCDDQLVDVVGRRSAPRRRWPRRSCSRCLFSRRGLLSVSLRRSTVATRMRCFLHGRRQSPDLAAAQRVEQQLHRVARSSPARNIARDTRLAAGSTSVHHQVRAQRLRLGVRRSAPPPRGVRARSRTRAFARSPARRGCSSLAAMASNAPRASRIDEQSAASSQSTTSSGSWTAYSSTSSSRRLTAMRRARHGSSAARRRAVSGVATTASVGALRLAVLRATVVAQPVGVDVELAGELHHVLVAHEVVRVLARRWRRRASAARARPSSVDRSAAASTRSSRNCRNGVAPLHRLQRAPPDRPARRRPGRGPAADRRP